MKRIVSLLVLLTALSGQAQTDSVIRIYFDFGSYELTGKDPFAQLDHSRWEPSLIVEARTDTTGNSEYNRSLADFRLRSVLSLLQKHPYFSVGNAIITGENYAVDHSYKAAKERCVIVRLRAKPSTSPNRTLPSVAKNTTPEKKQEEAPADSDRMPKSFHPDSAMVQGDVLILHNIEFLINETVITLESYPELQQVLEVMKSHPTMRIHIRGHVCCAPAQSLSDQRALKIYNYLLDNGIEPQRITHKGYSNKRPNPAAKNDLFSQEHRRVEIVIVAE